MQPFYLHEPPVPFSSLVVLLLDLQTNAYPILISQPTVLSPPTLPPTPISKSELRRAASQYLKVSMRNRRSKASKDLGSESLLRCCSESEFEFDLRFRRRRLQSARSLMNLYMFKITNCNFDLNILFLNNC